MTFIRRVNTIFVVLITRHKRVTYIDRSSDSSHIFLSSNYDPEYCSKDTPWSISYNVNEYLSMLNWYFNWILKKRGMNDPSRIGMYIPDKVHVF